MKRPLIPILNKTGDVVDNAFAPIPDDPRLNDGNYYDPEAYAKYLIFEASKLAEEKIKAVDAVVLKEREPLKNLYKWKYEKAKAGGFSEEERSAIIDKHSKQLDAEDLFLNLIDKAYQRVSQLIDKGNLIKATKALQKLKDFNSEAKLSDIEKATK